MSIEYIREYQETIRELRKVSGSENETALRGAFQACLIRYCSQRGLNLVTELPYKSVRPDGTVKDSLRLTWGHWEAKDTKDDLDKEISKKIKKGYPTTNIIFEDTETAVLYQNGAEAQRADMSDAEALDRLVSNFLKYEPTEIADFRKAIEQFKRDLPGVLEALREMIDESYDKKFEFREAAGEFLDLCREAINPAVEGADVREMLIQHILTKDIFLKVFGEDQFHKENNIANRLDGLEETFFTGDTRREMVDRLKGYYSAITVTAASIDSHQEKQKFLKAVYEDFYRVYNPKAADRLGVVYTPNEIVTFMIKAADELVHRHFGRRLYDKNVQILDPAAGTGTFITDLIEFFPKAHISHKYGHEMHANEVGILPYYIANLNIEYTYKQKTGEYKEFPNICFVDTLDNLSFEGGKGQIDYLGSLSHENLERVKRQNEKRISVIIGNPPYNANQRNENDKNKNREYPGIDARIRETYVQKSTAQKTKQYDMYKRFIRWASDRLDENGVLAFITNRAYLDSGQDDGFRKVVSEEFDEIYIIDLGSDVRKNPAISGTTHNVFGIQTGVSIGFFVRKEAQNRTCDIYYVKREDKEIALDKLAFLAATSFSDIDFEHVVPDEKNTWLDQTDNDFDNLLCVANEHTKSARTGREMDENAVFKLFSPGVSTNRDEWVYDFDMSNLIDKTRFFSDTYNSFVEAGDRSYSTVIKWSDTLRNAFGRNRILAYSKDCLIESLYRPFVRKLYFAAPMMSDRLTANHYETFGIELNKRNKVICFSGINSSKPFQILAVQEIPNLDFLEKTQCLPLYRYDDEGRRHSNITSWGLRQFHNQYKNNEITAEDIFHYIYAVFHNPVYLEKYTINLKREFPRLPFYKDFSQWVKWGKSLMKLHINYGKEKTWSFKRRDDDCKPGKAKLKADKGQGIIALDNQTLLVGIPPEAWEYKLGNRSALEWVLDQYKEKKPRDSTIREKFNTYRFADYKEEVVELLGRVCTVSVKTMKIVRDMESKAE